MQNEKEFFFIYQVDAFNDLMRKGFEIKCKGVFICDSIGIGPIVYVLFLDLHSTHLERIINRKALVKDAELIAIEYFKEQSNFGTALTVQLVNQNMNHG